MIWSNSIGINILNEGYARAQTFVVNNYVVGRAGAGPGIKIADTQPATGLLLVANNVVTNFTTNITKDLGLVNNGTYLDGTGFGQVDPV